MKKRNKHKIVLLLGNHDLSEWHGDVFKCSGYDLYASALLRPVFDKYKDYFQLAYATNNFLFTHAGVTNSWLKRHFLSSFKSLESATGISKMLNRQLSEWSKDFRDALSSAGFSRGGCGAPSPVWADKSELIRNPLPYINQVAGHTPVKTVKQVEAEALDYRLKANLWGELKYTAINGSYLDKYQSFLDIFLSQRAVTFHSWSFDSKFKHPDLSVSPNDLLYRNTYMLIRSVIVKYQKYMMKNYPGTQLEFIIMIDESGDKGLSSAKQFQEYLLRDTRVSDHVTDFRFLSTCNSTINNSMQAVDILTGLTASYYSKTNPSPSRIIFRDDVSKKYNDGVMLFKVRSSALPSLFDYKMHAYLLSENPHHIQISSMSIN